jgi:ApaG protein
LYKVYNRVGSFQFKTDITDDDISIVYSINDDSDGSDGRSDSSERWCNGGAAGVCLAWHGNLPTGPGVQMGVQMRNNETTCVECCVKSNIAIPKVSTVVMIRFTENVLDEIRGTDGLRRALFFCLTALVEGDNYYIDYVNGGVYSGVYDPSTQQGYHYILESNTIEQFMESYAVSLRDSHFLTRNVIDDDNLANVSTDLLTRSTDSATGCTVTRGVTVKASYQYIPEGNEGFGYCFMITFNESKDNAVYESVKLRTRHWKFTQKHGHVSEVDGDGVIGFFPSFTDDNMYLPRLSDNDSPRDYQQQPFVYSSCTGDRNVEVMEGYITFEGVKEDGSVEVFQAAIPKIVFSTKKPVFDFLV